MSLNAGSVYARIGLQMMTGQFNSASSALRGLGYDALYLAKTMGSVSKSSNQALSSVKNITLAINQLAATTIKTGRDISGSIGKINSDTSSYIKTNKRLADQYSATRNAIVNLQAQHGIMTNNLEREAAISKLYAQNSVTLGKYIENSMNMAKRSTEGVVVSNQLYSNSLKDNVNNIGNTISQIESLKNKQTMLRESGISLGEGLKQTYTQLIAKEFVSNLGKLNDASTGFLEKQALMAKQDVLLNNYMNISNGLSKSRASLTAELTDIEAKRASGIKVINAYSASDSVKKMAADVELLTTNYKSLGLQFPSLIDYLGNKFPTASKNLGIVKTAFSDIGMAISGTAVKMVDVDGKMVKVGSVAGALTKSFGSLVSVGLSVAMSIGQAVLKIGLLGAALGAIVTMGIAKWVYDVHSQFEKLNIRLAAVTGTAEQGRQAFAWVQDFAKRTPMEVAGVTDAFARLKDKGMDAYSALPKITDAVAGIGGSKKNLDGIIYALTQMSGLPKGISQEMRQLVNQGINGIALLNEAYGLHLASAKQAVEHFKSGAGVANAIIEAMGMKYAGLAEKMNSTFQGQLQELGENFKIFANKVGDNGALGGIKAIVVELNKRFDEWAKSGSINLLAAQFSDKLATAIKVVANGFLLMAKAAGIAYKAALMAAHPVYATEMSKMSGKMATYSDASKYFGSDSMAANRAKQEYNSYMKDVMGNSDFKAFRQQILDANDAMDGLNDATKMLNQLSSKKADWSKWDTSDWKKYSKNVVEDTNKQESNFRKIDDSLKTGKAYMSDTGALIKKSSLAVDDQAKKVKDLTGKYRSMINQMTKLNVPDVNSSLSSLTAKLDPKVLSLVGDKIKDIENQYVEATGKVANFAAAHPAMAKEAYDALNSMKNSAGQAISQYIEKATKIVDDFNQFQADGVNKAVGEEQQAGDKRLADFIKTVQGMKNADKLLSSYQIENAKYTANNIQKIYDSIELKTLQLKLSAETSSSGGGGTFTSAYNTYASTMADLNSQFKTGAINLEQFSYSAQIAGNELKDNLSSALDGFGIKIKGLNSDADIYARTQRDLSKAIAEGTITQKDSTNALRALKVKLWDQSQAGQLLSGVTSTIGSNVSGVYNSAKSFATGNWGQGAAELFSLAADNSPKLRSALDSINESIGKVLGVLGDAIAPVAELIADILKDIAPLLKKIIQAIEPAIRVIVEILKPFLSLAIGIMNKIGDAVKIIADVVENILNAIKSIGNVGGSIVHTVEGIPVVGDVVSGVSSVVKSIGGLFHDGGSVGAPFKYHTGGSSGLPMGTYKSDEVPAVLQTGEIILSRSTVAEAKRSMRSNATEEDSASTQLLMRVVKELREMRKQQTYWTIYGLNTVTQG